MTERRDLHEDPFADIQPVTKAQIAADIPDVGQSQKTLAERLLEAVERQYGPLPPEPPVTGATIRAHCRFCWGKGCLNCDTLADQEYHRQFPAGLPLLAHFRTDDPEDRALLPVLLRGIKDAVTPAEAMGTLEENAALVRALQKVLAESDRETQP
jgi:hypothetical protein